MQAEFIENLGHTVEVKTITLERLSKGGIAVMGTPKLTLEEVNELLGVLFHELHVRGR